MKAAGIFGAVLSLALIFWKYDTLSLWSLGLGVALAAATFVFLSTLSVEKAPPPAPNDEWQNKFRALQNESNHSLEGLKQELQKFQQKLTRSEERCTSYQKLVDVHQSEIDKLQQEKQTLSTVVIEKDRKLNEAYLSKLEPDLFDIKKELS